MIPLTMRLQTPNAKDTRARAPALMVTDQLGCARSGGTHCSAELGGGGSGGRLSGVSPGTVILGRVGAGSGPEEPFGRIAPIVVVPTNRGTRALWRRRAF